MIVVELPILSVWVHQSIMVADFDDVSLPDRGETMGDHETGAPFINIAMTSWMTFSVWASTLLVASSRIMISRFAMMARAMVSSCRENNRGYVMSFV